MLPRLAFQHVSTASRHHWALFLLARTGLPPTSTHTGFVWLLGKIRSATQLDCFGVNSNATSSTRPSASTVFFCTACPFTTSSTSTCLPSPLRARSTFQYGCSLSGFRRVFFFGRPAGMAARLALHFHGVP